MSDKFQNRYRIPSSRMNGWDYGQHAAYFVTICTQGRECYFGNIENEKMVLSGMGIIADILWHEIKNHDHVELGAFVVMPNHIHGILILNGPDLTTVETLHATSPHDAQTLHATSLPPQQQSPPRNIQMSNISPKSNSLSTIIRSYKSAVTKHAHRLGFDFAWQSRFWDHIIRDDDEYSRIKTYIETNPEHWSDDQLNS